LHGIDYINLPKQERGNVVVMPNLEAQDKQIVSVFDHYSPLPEDVNLLKTPDDTFIGIIVHELAHEFDKKNDRKKLPVITRKILEKQRQNIKSGKTRLENRNEYFAQDETEVDIIAASFGYTKQIVAKIDFMIDRFKTMAPKWKIERSISDPSPQDWIEELEFRKQQVLKYCP
jgi:molybdopterin synthase catalytic subunit